MGNNQNRALTEVKTVVDLSSGRLKWPEKVCLYHLPPERELLPDKARRLMFETYLSYCNLSYSTVTAINVDYMSPNGNSPFIVLHFPFKPVLFADFFKFASFVESQSLGIGKELDEEAKAECTALVSLVRLKLLQSMEYITWISAEPSEDTLAMYGFGLPWPAKQIAPYLHYLSYAWNHWEEYCTREDEVQERINDVFKALSIRLGTNDSFYQSGPSLIDAVVSGCLEAILSNGPSRILDSLTSQGSENLTKFCEKSLSSQRKGLEFISYPSTLNLSSIQ